MRVATEKSCVVKINGKERTIRKTSIAKLAPSTSTTTSSSLETVTIPRAEYDELTMEIETLTNSLKQLELKMKRHLSN